MEYEYGIVEKTEGNRMLVQASPGGGCACCAAKDGCMTKDGMKTRTLWMNNTVNAVPGDRVSFYIEEKGMVLASILLYGLPVVMLFCGIIAGNFVYMRMGMEKDIASIILGLASVLVAFLILRLISPVLSKSKIVQPVAVAVENNDSSGITSSQ